MLTFLVTMIKSSDIELIDFNIIGNLIVYLSILGESSFFLFYF